jgi:CRISPR/Cas system CSM-associated protein Csm3 (group 7 of RAMP superfamily)
MINKDTAKEEITKWLDYKKIREAERQSNDVFIERLSSAIESEQLVLNDLMELEFELAFPIEGENITLSKVIFKPRMSALDREQATKGVNAGDGYGRINAIAAELCKQPRAILKKLDTEDYKIVEAIAVFFA